MAKMVDMASEPKPPVEITAGDMKPRWYGGCICLCDDELEKLGLDGDLPDVGEMIHFEGLAKVTSASKHQISSPDGKADEHNRVELEITHMGIIGGDEKPRADKWYSHEEPDEDD